MEDRARVVIVGAGIVGCGAAEHLTRLGWREVVVLDQGPLFEAGEKMQLQYNIRNTYRAIGTRLSALSSRLSPIMK